MYEAGGYRPYIKEYYSDMLVFLLNWGGERGKRHLLQYLIKNRNLQPGMSEYMNKRNFLRALLQGSYWYFDFEIDETALPLLVLTLEEKGVQGGMTLEPGKEIDLRWCDSAALVIQKMLKRKWGFELDLSVSERDKIINQMQIELTDKR